MRTLSALPSPQEYYSSLAGALVSSQSNPQNHSRLAEALHRLTPHTPEAISGAAQEGVIVFCIPPNTTHAAQPLDVSFFGPLKRHWSSACHAYLAKNPGSVVTKLQFNSLFSQAWYKAIRPETIISGFRKTGICPLDKDAIRIVSLSPPEVEPSTSEVEP